MQLIVLCLLACVALCFGESQTVIENTKVEKDGIEYCEYDGEHIVPGDNFNKPGKCQLQLCLFNFDVQITDCPFDGKQNN